MVKFNYCHDLVRYGVFFEQSATHDLALGNVCNNDGRDINLYNNSTTPRGPTAFNNVISNSLMGNNGIRNGSTANTGVETSHNFIFDNTIINASIQSQQNGTENYYSQNYLLGGTLSTAGAESFFNSADVSGNLQLRDSNSGLTLVVPGASTTDGAAVVTALFLAQRYDIKYVYDYSSKDLEAPFRVAALWAGQPGSFVIWALWGLIAAQFLVRRTRHAER